MNDIFEDILSMIRSELPIKWGKGQIVDVEDVDLYEPIPRQEGWFEVEMLAYGTYVIGDVKIPVTIEIAADVHVGKFVDPDTGEEWTTIDDVDDFAVNNINIIH